MISQSISEESHSAGPAGGGSKSCSGAQMSATSSQRMRPGAVPSPYYLRL